MKILWTLLGLLLTISSFTQNRIQHYEDVCRTDPKAIELADFTYLNTESYTQREVCSFRVAKYSWVIATQDDMDGCRDYIRISICGNPLSPGDTSKYSAIFDFVPDSTLLSKPEKIGEYGFLGAFHISRLEQVLDILDGKHPVYCLYIREEREGSEKPTVSLSLRNEVILNEQ